MQIKWDVWKPVHLIWILIVGLSFVIRIPFLYDTSYQWRPLHTELTVYWFVQEGIDLLHYQTPLFGPPWQIPIEFPLFQAIAALVFQAGLGSLDFACRLTALLCFYASALFLYLLCKKLISDALARFTIIALYLWLPFNIHYSAEPLIDYLALGCALAYFYFLLVWLESRSSLVTALLAAICGALGMLVKPTTMPLVLVPILVFVLKDILAKYRAHLKPVFHGRGLLSTAWTQRSYWIGLILMAAIPVIAWSLWTRHADSIKDRSVFTRWHTSRAMVNWYFGTWEHRTDPQIWINTIDEAEDLLLPYGLSIFAALGVLAAGRLTPLPGERAETRLFILSFLVGVGVLLMIFLSLYQQQYYYISFSASMAILGGYGLARFWQMGRTNGHLPGLLLVTWAVVFLALNVRDHAALRMVAATENRKLERSIARWQRVQQHVPPDNWVAIVAYDWDPSYAYWLQRKAMVVSPRELEKPVCQVLSDPRFTLVVVADRSYERNEELLGHALQCFTSWQEVSPGMYEVSHSGS